jgi:Asp-tRNA(Asn)/Glu-tRNA(Gln) amidotransferase A subunit family amidase
VDVPAGLSRRRALGLLGGAAAGSVALRSALAAALASPGPVDPGHILQAASLAGLDLTKDEADLMVKGIGELQADLAKLRAVSLDNGTPPALVFDPRSRSGGPSSAPQSRATSPDAAGARPAGQDDLAFLPVSALAPLLRSRRVSSSELTRAYLERIRRFDPSLQAVVTLTEELALAQARQADAEIAAGRYRGPLHGVPWVAKDILAVPGYPTTWGSVPYKTQVRPEKATVVARLEEAGAVLLAKSSLGELAMGDVWFGGKTKNPWKLEQGSSGSSAGSASMTAAGLTGFGIGTETWGSIVSPCTRCGSTGLRPTFGRVSRFGVMALSWSMDKIGALARSVEDCALVFAAIQGADGLDPAAVDAPFSWPPPSPDLKRLRIGFVPVLFDEDRAAHAEKPEDKADLAEWAELDRRALRVFEGLGVSLAPVTIPTDLPVSALSWILTAEASAAFDDLTRSGTDQEMVKQDAEAWPNVFRLGQMLPAVEYVRANRIRTLLQRQWAEVFRSVDVLVVPSYGGDVLLATNLTGHPCVVVPDGFLSRDGTPVSLSFLGRLDGEADLLSVALAWQRATEFHLKRPPLSAAAAGERR